MGDVRRTRTPEVEGGTISAVRPGSIADRAGLEPGDVLCSINGHGLRDLIDYRYHSAEEELALVVQRDGQRHDLEIERGYDQDLGLEFSEPLFDGMRQCNNHCPFCFIQQMPKGFRRSLYVRDDDYRHSFLMGGFVTLTNLGEEDWQRIGEQHLSPLFVSIHATDPQTRRRMLGNPAAPDVMAQLRRLGRMGIRVHGQIVVWPGVNDGAILRQSVEDVASLWPTVATLAIVPVGLTRYHRGGVALAGPSGAAHILDLADSFIPRFRRRFGRTWLFPSDEIYMLAGRPIPRVGFYDDHAQRENGVGLIRFLLDDWQQARRSLRRVVGPLGRVTLVCGELIAPLLSEIAAELTTASGTEFIVVPVANRFFGQSVTVSGLLTGRDVLAVLLGRDLGRCVFLPRAMFDAQARLTLDDLTREEIGRHLGAPTAVASGMSEVLAACTDQAGDTHPPFFRP